MKIRTPTHPTQYMRALPKKHHRKRRRSLTMNILVVSPDYLPHPRLEVVPPEDVVLVESTELKEGEICNVQSDNTAIR